MKVRLKIYYMRNQLFFSAQPVPFGYKLALFNFHVVSMRPPWLRGLARLPREDRGSNSVSLVESIGNLPSVILAQ